MVGVGNKGDFQEALFFLALVAASCKAMGLLDLFGAKHFDC